MPKIYIATDEWYPWFEHGVPSGRYAFAEEELIEVTKDELLRLDVLAEAVKEYQTTLAKLADRKSVYDL